MLRGDLRGHDVIVFARGAGYSGEIFFVSGVATREEVLAAFAEGARYAPKLVKKPFGLEPVRRAVLDHVRFDLRADHPLVRAESSARALTPTESQIVLALANGRSRADVACAWSEHAWKAHVHRILGKLRCTGGPIECAVEGFRAAVVARMRTPPPSRRDGDA